MRLRNILFSSLVCVVLLSAAAYKSADLTDTLPHELDNGTVSYLEGGSLQPLPLFSIERFMTGDYQDEMESYLSGCFPARDEALLLNAGYQRTLIDFASTPFGIDAIPTFYSSAKYYSKAAGTLFEQPTAGTSSVMSKLSLYAGSLNSIIEKHPDIRLVSFVPACSRITQANPVSNLQSNSLTFPELLSFMENQLDSRIILLGSDSASVEDFQQTILAPTTIGTLSEHTTAIERYLKRLARVLLIQWERSIIPNGRLLAQSLVRVYALRETTLSEITLSKCPIIR